MMIAPKLLNFKHFRYHFIFEILAQNLACDLQISLVTNGPLSSLRELSVGNL